MLTVFAVARVSSNMSPRSLNLKTDERLRTGPFKGKPSLCLFSLDWTSAFLLASLSWLDFITLVSPANDRWSALANYSVSLVLAGGRMHIDHSVRAQALKYKWIKYYFGKKRGKMGRCGTASHLRIETFEWRPWNDENKRNKSAENIICLGRRTARGERTFKPSNHNPVIRFTRTPMTHQASSGLIWSSNSHSF